MSAFSPLGPHSLESDSGDTFWPSFTDIMMVVVLIFLLASSLLIVRNYQLVAELQDSIEAERMAAQVIESTTLENSTLEERLINAEQMNSILRLRVLNKEELLNKATQENVRKQQIIASLESEKQNLTSKIQLSKADLNNAYGKINQISAESEQFANQLGELKRQLEQQKKILEASQLELEMATAEIAVLNATTQKQKDNLLLQEQEKINYNRQLLTLKGDYEVVKAKYDQLVKPARSAQGKYVAEVYYVKEKGGEVIRFKEPGDQTYTNLPLAKVEERLTRLKKEKGKDLYVKIIIPKDSGLTYNEAWNLMRSLLDKYDYYYQEQSRKETIDSRDTQDAIESEKSKATVTP